MNVNYSKSKQCFSTKEEARQQLKSVEWENVSTTLDELKDNLSKGYVINATYNGEHNTSNLIGRQFVSIDCDYTSMTLENAVKAVKAIRLEPSIYYNTYSATNTNIRWRFIYVFDYEYEPGMWQCISNAIYDSVKEATGCFLDDSCNRPTQNTFGTDKEVYSTDKVYTYEDLIRCPIFPMYFHTGTIESMSIDNALEVTENDNRVIEAYNQSKSNKDFVYTAIESGWTPITKSDIQWQDGEVAQSINQKTFCEIYHSYFINENGNYQVKRLFDGERRRPSFNNWLYLIRICKPNISLGELLCNAIYLVYTYLDNSDKVFTKRYVLECCQKAMRRDLKYRGYKGDRKYITNKAECLKQGITAQKAVGMLKHNQSKSEVMSVYDPELSVNENMNVMEGMDIKVGKSSLYRILKEEGIVCDKECLNNTIKSLVDLNKSVRQNKKMLEELGIKVSLGKLNTLINEVKVFKFSQTDIL